MTTAMPLTNDNSSTATATTTKDNAMLKEPTSPFHQVPAPPPPSPAVGVMSGSTAATAAAFYNNSHLLGKRPVRGERSQSWGHRSAPSLTVTPPYSPVSNSATFSSGIVPFMPNLVVNGSSSAIMEQTMQTERQRRSRCERTEQSMDATQLKAVLRDERIRMARMAAELAHIKATTVASQLESEVSEEGRINSLRRQLEEQEQKGRIRLELEREEELLTNTLQMKLEQVKKEKAVLEERIEQEQKSHAVLEERLKKRVEDHSVAESIEECDDEGEVDDSILPDLAAMGEHTDEDFDCSCH